MTSAERPVVLVFRKRLLPYSETFIAAQAYALQSFRPVFCGMHIDRRGLHHLQRADCEVLAESRWAAEILRLPMRRGGPPPRQWLERLRRHRPVLVHAHFGADAHAALPVARALGVPIVCTFHGHDIIGELASAHRRRLAAVFGEIRAAIAVSKFIEACLIGAGCPPEKIVQHYIGIDPGLYAGPRAEAAQPTVLFVGRLIGSKGCDEAIEAAASLARELPDIRLVVAGDGPERRRLEEKARQVRLSCEFLGAVPPTQVRRLMHEAWVLIGPRRTSASGYAEGLGMAFLEALASGLPIVGYRNGGVAEAVVHGECGLLAPEGDLDALRRMLRSVLLEPQLRARLSHGGREHVRRSFDLRQQTAALELCYRAWSGAAPDRQQKCG